LAVELVGIHPTRLELLRLKRRRSLAESIIDILKKDLDTLLVTLFDFIKEIPTIRGRISEVLKEAYSLFVEAEMIAGSRKIEEVSLVAQTIGLEVAAGKERGVLGISLPSFKLSKGANRTSRVHFSLLDSPLNLYESSIKIENALGYILRLAEIEGSIREILDVIAVKKRQINRIEYKILPQLDAAIRYIELIIEETERQDAIRVRVLQRKRKERIQKTRT